MAGLYLHIPFCRQACHYCDFHFSTAQRGRDEMVAALVTEMALQQNYLAGQTLQTVYFGGGTPSLLNEAQLTTLLEAIHQHFNVAAGAEITLEANPDDLTQAKIRLLRQVGINRLSIGIQSFHEPHLQTLNRAHSALEAVHCVQHAQDEGITNISVDLIYAIPHLDHSVWAADLQKAIDLGVPHISAYSLTVEPRTAFGRWREQGKFRPADDDFAATQFEMGTAALEEAGFEAYEISNFAQPGRHSRHNSAYWQRQSYLGIGPSAHSYDGFSRQWNVANNAQYLAALAQGRVPATAETLSVADQVNEYLLTTLRTHWGCDLREIQRFAGLDLRQRVGQTIAKYQRQGLLQLEGDTLRLTRAGRLLADGIAADLFVEE